MIKRILQAILISAVIGGSAFAHSGKPEFHVIIDTDGALDDMRSISMLLSGNDIRVLAVTCSQGTLQPDSVYRKVKSLLSEYHHEGIPVGTGEELDRELPVWSSFAQRIAWGKPVLDSDKNSNTPSIDVLNRAIDTYHDKITLVALGSLKTYADWIKSNPRMIRLIDRIVWYNGLPVEAGFNYKVSPGSYELISQTGIPLDIIAGDSERLLINEDYLGTIKKAKSIYAEQIALVHARPEIAERINQQHLQLWDDLVPLYLTVPLLFETETNGNIRHITLSRSIPDKFIYETVAKLLESATRSNNRVFNNFPVDSSLYKPEYAAMLNSTIEKFGLIEWKAICMTNEIHGHTGIYSIIGAKMGIRAMEYFNVGVNNVTVTTFAGEKPPLSCFNDGIQISTGATIGQGLITVSDSIATIPSAVFECNGLEVSITLKPEIATRMREEIKYGVQNYGLHDEKYWIYIEQLAIQYWNSFNRYEIFTIDFISDL